MHSTKCSVSTCSASLRPDSAPTCRRPGSRPAACRRSSGRRSPGDAAVVDLDLLARLQVVVDDHLAAAADQRAPHLDRREPVDVDVRDQAVVEEAGQVRDVLRPARRRAPCRSRDRRRPLRRAGVHDREVVDRQIPEHVDVALEQPQVDAHRVEVVELAELARRRSARGSCGPRRCRRTCGPPSAPARGARPLRPAARPAPRRRERLLDQDVLAGLQRLHRQLEVAGDRRRDGDGVDLRIAEQLVDVGRRLDGG